MDANEPLALVSALCIMLVCMWIGYRIDKSIHDFRLSEFKRAHPADPLPHTSYGESGIGFGCVVGITLICILVIAGG